MEAYLQDLITQSLAFTLMVVLLVAFFESLALVGLLLPGTVMMASIGALIGSGKVDFYYAWAAGIVGCLLGDWISYFVGRAFKGPLHRWSFLKKNKALLDKTEHALHQHSMATILIGRFVGPTRPLVPMVAGMLDMPFGRFLLVSLCAAAGWSMAYLFAPSAGLFALAVFGFVLGIQPSVQHESLMYPMYYQADQVFADDAALRVEEDGPASPNG